MRIARENDGFEKSGSRRSRGDDYQQAKRVDNLDSD